MMAGAILKACTLWAHIYTNMKVEVLVTLSRPPLCDPMNHSPPGSSVHAILQARTLEWVAIPVSSSRHRGQYMPRSWEKIELGEFQDQKDDWIISS